MEEEAEKEEDEAFTTMNSCGWHRRDCLRAPATPSQRSAQGRRRRAARAEHAQRAQGLERENEGVASGLTGKPSPPFAEAPKDPAPCRQNTVDHGSSLSLMSDGRHHDLAFTDDVEQGNVARGTEWDDEFSLQPVV